MKKFIGSIAVAFLLSACTDYLAEYKDEYGNSFANANDAQAGDTPIEDPGTTIPDDSGDVPTSDDFNGTLTDPRDGHVYKTVTIGSQIWMAKNLNYETADSYCYGDDASNCTSYGRLYSWPLSVGKTDAECGWNVSCTLPTVVQGICPSGWHLPSAAEFETLIAAVGGESSAGKALKSKSGWFNDGNGTDAYGFSAYPGGNKGSSGKYVSKGSSAFFWTSTMVDETRARSVSIGTTESISANTKDKTMKFSIRCVKD